MAVHWRSEGTRQTACGRPLTVNYAEFDVGHVNCRTCLHTLGLFVPLAYLRRHQLRWRIENDPAWAKFAWMLKT